MTKLKITNETGWQSKIIDCPEVGSISEYEQAETIIKAYRYLIELNSTGREPIVHVNSNGTSWLFNAKNGEFYGIIPETF